MRYRLAGWLVPVLSLLSAAPALAQVRVDAQASGFRYVLNDLVRGDAFVPELKRATTSEPEVSGQIRVFDWDGNIRDDDRADSGPGSMVLEQSWGRALYSRTSYDAGGAHPVLGLSVAMSPHEQQSVFIDVNSSGPWTAFELSPHTSITFELDVSMRLSMMPETDTAHWRGTAFAALGVSAYDPGTGSYSDTDELRSWVGDTDHGPYQLEDAKDGLLRVSYANTGNDWVRGEVNYQMWGYALVFNDVAPVPEPSVWGMYAVGISLLGAACRLRMRAGVDRKAPGRPAARPGP